MSKDYNYEIGYETLQDEWKLQCKRTPRGVTLVKGGNNIYLQFKTLNTAISKYKSRTTFIRQAGNLWQYKQQLQQLLARKLGGFADSTHLIDGFPIPWCHYQRARKCRLFKGSADANAKRSSRRKTTIWAYALRYCASKNEKYYGFHGHLVISAEGVITGFSLTAANTSEREALWDMTAEIEGLLTINRCEI